MKLRTYPSDEVRRTDEAFGAPERVVEISSMTFELSRKPTVENGTAAALFEEIAHERRRFHLAWHTHWFCV